MRFSWSREGSTLEKSSKTMAGLSKIDFSPNLDRGQFKAFPVSIFYDFCTILGGSGGLRDVLWMALDECQISSIFRDFLGPQKLRAHGPERAIWRFGGLVNYKLQTWRLKTIQ